MRVTHFLPGGMSASGDTWCGVPLEVGSRETGDHSRVTCSGCKHAIVQRAEDEEAARRRKVFSLASRSPGTTEDRTP